MAWFARLVRFWLNTHMVIGWTALASWRLTRRAPQHRWRVGTTAAAFEAVIRGPVYHQDMVVVFSPRLYRCAHSTCSLYYHLSIVPKLFCHFYMAWPASIHSSARAHCSVCFSVPGSASVMDAEATETNVVSAPSCPCGRDECIADRTGPRRRATTSKGDAPTDKVRGAFRRFCKAFQRR
jgi:hypothetical protein